MRPGEFTMTRSLLSAWSGSLTLLAAVLLFGQTAEKPRLFSEGVIPASVGSGVAFSQDGKTMYFSQDRSYILLSHSEDGKWLAPSVAEFSGKYRDGDPFASADGLQLFFWSMRPLDGRQRKSIAIWVIDRNGAGWSAPRDVGVLINGPEGGAGFPAVTANGTLYFMANRPDSLGGFDIYRAQRIDGQYAKPENLGRVINSDHAELDAYVAPDESYIVFTSDRPGGLGSGDLYVSRRKDGAWTPPQNLGPMINTAGFECCPSVSPDGKHFYFTTQGLGRNGIYEADIAALSLDQQDLPEEAKLFDEGIISTPGSMSITFAPDGRTLWFAEAGASIMVSHLDGGNWSAAVPIEFSGRYFDFSPCLSADGSALVFSSSRPRAGQQLSLGLWAAERTASGWSAPKELGAAVNGSGGTGSPSLAVNGTLYFVAQRPDSIGGLDIYRSKRFSGQYDVPGNLGPGINSPQSENDVCVAPDESFIVFTSSRPGGQGESDFYVSVWKDGAWGQPHNPGPTINSTGSECCPSISPDGKYFFFNRPGTGKPGIYQVGIEALGLEQK
jgi:Tol biopolymer transport system component